MQSHSAFRRLRLAGWLAVAALVFTTPAKGAEKTYPLKLHLSPGEKYAFDTSTSMNEKGQVLVNNQPAQPIDQAMEQHRKGVVEILSVEDGLPAAMVINYDADSENKGHSGPQQLPAFTLAGKTVHVSRKQGIVTTDLGNGVDTATVQEVGHMLDPDQSIYPKEPVAVNQEWDGDAAALGKSFQLGPGDKVSLKCKLTGVHEEKGRQIADVTLTGHLVKHDQGFVETNIDLEGTTQIDLQTGQPLDSTMNGKIASRGERKSTGPDGAPVAVSVNADGQIQVRQRVTVLNAAAAAAEAANASPMPTSAPSPAQSAENPLTRPREAAFAGMFKADQVSLELRANNGDQYSGTLFVGEKKFPVAATASGNKLTGNFESDGSKFDFSAALDGTNLTLVSEGNTYTLKKQAINPLARPAPKNPLAK